MLLFFYQSSFISDSGILGSLRDQTMHAIDEVLAINKARVLTRIASGLRNLFISYTSLLFMLIPAPYALPKSLYATGRIKTDSNAVDSVTMLAIPVFRL